MKNYISFSKYMQWNLGPAKDIDQLVEIVETIKCNLQNITPLLRLIDLYLIRFQFILYLHIKQIL